MTFFIRKPLSFLGGLLHLNLSKSGVGESVGVRGLRVGQRPDVSQYLFAGRKGLYARHEFGKPANPATESEAKSEAKPEKVSFSMTMMAQKAGIKPTVYKRIAMAKNEARFSLDLIEKKLAEISAFAEKGGLPDVFKLAETARIHAATLRRTGPDALEEILGLEAKDRRQ